MQWGILNEALITQTCYTDQQKAAWFESDLVVSWALYISWQTFFSQNFANVPLSEPFRFVWNFDHFDCPYVQSSASCIQICLHTINNRWIEPIPCFILFFLINRMYITQYTRKELLLLQSHCIFKILFLIVRPECKHTGASKKNWISWISFFL